jgi:hypothetical protein
VEVQHDPLVLHGLKHLVEGVKRDNTPLRVGGSSTGIGLNPTH